MNKTKNYRQWLLILLVANVLATVFHFTENFIFIKNYPQPNWINAYHVIIFWVIMTSLGVVGYFLYKRRFSFLSYLCLYTYCAMTIVSLGHYLYAPIWDLSLKMNAFLICEMLTAITLAGFTFWLQVFSLLEDDKILSNKIIQ